MKYEVFGPFIIKSTPGGAVVQDEKRKFSEFWTAVDVADEHLRNARGCYVFCTGSNKNIIPWYVGKTNNPKGFFAEVFAVHKLALYNYATDKYDNRQTLSMFLIARLTPGGKLAKSVPRQELDWLEKLLIGSALRRNAEIMNTRDTKYLKNLIVPGLFGNAGKGKAKAHSVQRLKRAFTN
jgi:hypothetical protein